MRLRGRSPPFWGRSSVWGKKDPFQHREKKKTNPFWVQKGPIWGLGWLGGTQNGFLGGKNTLFGPQKLSLREQSSDGEKCPFWGWKSRLFHPNPPFWSSFLGPKAPFQQRCKIPHFGGRNASFLGEKRPFLGPPAATRPKWGENRPFGLRRGEFWGEKGRFWGRTLRWVHSEAQKQLILR